MTEHDLTWPSEPSSAVGPVEEYEHVGGRRRRLGTGTAEERYADEFAAALLMPRDFFLAAISEGLGIIRLTLRFGVPPEHVVYRCRLLGIDTADLPRV